MTRLRRSIIILTILSVVAILLITQHLQAVSRDPDKEAALRQARSGGSRVLTKSSASAQAPAAPHELAIGERQPSFLGGQFYMAIMNSELTDTYTEKGWRGAGRSMSPGMGMPSYTVPAGGFDSPLWTSACGITAYLPNSAWVLEFICRRLVCWHEQCLPQPTSYAD